MNFFKKIFNFLFSRKKRKRNDHFGVFVKKQCRCRKYIPLSLTGFISLECRKCGGYRKENDTLF